MHWYLVYTHCWHEKKVKERLERERFGTFLPVTERWSKKNHQKRITVPLFPCYLFVRVEMNADIYLKILRIKGVIGFFCNGGKPAIIPDKKVDSIQISFSPFTIDLRPSDAMTLRHFITFHQNDRPKKPNQRNRPNRLNRPNKPERRKDETKESYNFMDVPKAASTLTVNPLNA